MYLLQGFHFDWEKQGYLVERTQTLRKKKKQLYLGAFYLFIYLFIYLGGETELTHECGGGGQRERDKQILH